MKSLNWKKTETESALGSAEVVYAEVVYVGCARASYGFHRRKEKNGICVKHTNIKSKQNNLINYKKKHHQKHKRGDTPKMNLNIYHKAKFEKPEAESEKAHFGEQKSCTRASDAFRRRKGKMGYV